MKKMIDIPLDMCNFFDSYWYSRLCIHFYWISHNNIKYINFEYIILTLPKILVKIHHCLH